MGDEGDDFNSEGTPERRPAEERRRDREYARMFLQAFRTNDVEQLPTVAAMLSDESLDGWRIAFKKVARLPPPSNEFRQSFFRIWIQSKSIQRQVGNDLLTIAGLRVLLPPYTGPDIQLYRGDSFRNGRCRTYGIAWSADRAIAEKFAKDVTHRLDEGGSVLIETTAPARAIISSSKLIGDIYEEREYLVDRKLLKNVRVVERYPQCIVPGLDMPDELSSPEAASR